MLLDRILAVSFSGKLGAGEIASVNLPLACISSNS